MENSKIWYNLLMLISDFKTRLQQKIHGRDLSKVQDVNNLIYEAAGNVLLRIDPAETKRVTSLTNGLYDNVYNYATPTDLKGDKIISIRPQANANKSDNFHQTYNQEFALRKDFNSFDVEFNGGTKTINISKNLTQGVTINENDSTTSNGTWVVGGNATDLTTDTVNYVSGSGSLKFNISSGGTTSYIENSTMSAVDLTNYLNLGSIFTYVYFPGSTISAVSIRIGTDSSNYYTFPSITTTHDSTAFVSAFWNLLRTDWSTSVSTTGSPTITNIKYVRITFTHTTAAVTGVRVDNIVARLPTFYEMVYYSKYLFKNSSGTWIEKPTAIDDSDSINLDTESFNVLLYETAYLVAQEIQGEDSSFDVGFWRDKRKETWDNYMSSYRTEAQRRRSTYYRKLK